MRRIALMLGALSIVSAAYAQDATKPATDAQTPAVSTPDSKILPLQFLARTALLKARPRNGLKARGTLRLPTLQRVRMEFGPLQP